MEIISGTTQFQIWERTAVAIGKFDGMHLGHRFLIGELVRMAHRETEDTLKTVVFTFDPSPAAFFSGKDIPELFTKEEKREVFASLGVDILIEFPMNEETAKMPAEAFVEDVLAGSLNAGLVLAGGDLSFGHQGAGDFKLLQSYAETLGFHAEQIDKVVYDGAPISSSRIRKAIRDGRIEEANTMLDHHYAFSGVVVHGAQLGHTLGFPTINLVPPAGKLLPPNGVYLSRALLPEDGSDWICGITNIGRKPTVQENGAVVAETYLYGTFDTLYGREVRLELLSFRRPEQRFDSVDALKDRLQKDIEEGRRLHGL